MQGSAWWTVSLGGSLWWWRYEGGPAPELGCRKTEPLRSTGSSLSPSLDFQSCQDNQVFPACRPLPDTVDIHGPSCASWLCPCR
ncbi:hypothetical protein QTO34_018904 [Cnephaeus nilssonii]|uniref:Uncharacterized protein n=1 Tax=Cnephaeus nilssonii TaxID=3371016 RepID=A0AA40LND6_CNENI|nr:hypothetical protein QTO34_018904 [Eptesicus nilssonii]